MTDTIDFIASAKALSAEQHASDWLNNARQQGNAALQKAAWPTRKTEAWKYTSLYPLTAENYLQTPPTAALTEGDIADFKINNLDAYQLVFVNGRFCADLSDDLNSITEFTVANFADLDNDTQVAAQLNSTFKLEKHLFAQINNSLLTDGLYLVFPANKKISKPVLY
ncbi:MAG: hypothetical protein CSA49_05535 [Gammaproteobacteria bacterium]|nr:MAG: hypothetical protein CSA49_05535 [Gammaproteobacteria bacterium]